MNLPTTIDTKVLAQLEQYLPLLQIKRKVQKAAADMASKVVFDEAEHTYKRVSDSKFLAGVTSVSGLVPKKWLAAWGAKEAVKFLGYSDFPEDTALAQEMLSKLAGIGAPLLDVEQEDEVPAAIKQYIALLKEAKGAQARKKSDALVDGKAGHAWIEEWIKAKIAGTNLPAVPKEGLLERPLTMFVKWAEENVALWLLSEAVVSDVENEYAGTLDAAAIMKDGSLAIVDAKFASHVSEEYYLQTAGYAATFEPHGVVFDKRIIVRLPKTLEKDEWDKAARKYKKVANTIEVVEVPTPYDLDKTTFLAALPVRKWIGYLERRAA